MSNEEIKKEDLKFMFGFDDPSKIGLDFDSFWIVEELTPKLLYMLVESHQYYDDEFDIMIGDLCVKTNDTKHVDPRVKDYKNYLGSIRFREKVKPDGVNVKHLDYRVYYFRNLSICASCLYVGKIWYRKCKKGEKGYPYKKKCNSYALGHQKQKHKKSKEVTEKLDNLEHDLNETIIQFSRSGLVPGSIGDFLTLSVESIKEFSGKCFILAKNSMEFYDFYKDWKKKEWIDEKIK